jgi:hypothetical protein
MSNIIHSPPSFFFLKHTKAFALAFIPQTIAFLSRLHQCFFLPSLNYFLPLNPHVRNFLHALLLCLRAGHRNGSYRARTVQRRILAPRPRPLLCDVRRFCFIYINSA